MPGDDEIKDPTYLTTRAVTINASSEKIWPWLPWIEKRQWANLAPKLGNRLIFKKQELITALKKILRVYINDVQQSLIP